MTKQEMIEELQKVCRFYKSEMDNEEYTIWYNSIKDMNIKRFRYIISKAYERCKYMPKLADIISIYKEIGYKDFDGEVTTARVACDICDGKGFVIFNKIIDNYPYEYAARCNCANSEKYKAFPTIEESGMTKEYFIGENKKFKARLKPSQVSMAQIRLWINSLGKKK